VLLAFPFASCSPRVSGAASEVFQFFFPSFVPLAMVFLPFSDYWRMTWFYLELCQTRRINSFLPPLVLLLVPAIFLLVKIGSDLAVFPRAVFDGYDVVKSPLIFRRPIHPLELTAKG